MIAVRLGVAIFWLAVFVKLEPHHFWLGSNPQAPAMLGFELFVHTAQISTTIRCQEPAWILFFFTVAKQGTIEPANLWRPRQLHEGFWLWNTDKFSRFWPVAQVISRAIGEEVHRCAINQLKPFFGNRLPVICRNAFPHDLSGYRNKLQIEILDPHSVNHFSDFFDFFVAPRRFDKLLKICFSQFSSP